MHAKRLFPVLLVIFSGLSTLSCSENGQVPNPQNTNSNRQITVSSPQPDENEELGALITLPYEPEDVVWRKSGDGRSLLAVLRFSPEDTRKIRESLTAGGQGTPRSITPEDWFPAELQAQSEANPDAMIIGEAFPATLFFQPPYGAGTITAVSGTDFFILELTAK
ncbi:MAG: hypothetical protein ACK42A_01305 [Pyrinomonadaceae bacterium]|jgi:hypothetical protein